LFVSESELKIEVKTGLIC